MSDLQRLTAHAPQPTVVVRQASAPLSTPAWLSELERARWDAQPRYQSALTAEAALVDDPAVMPFQGKPAHAQTLESIPEVDGLQQSQQDRAQPMPGGSDVSHNALNLCFDAMSSPAAALVPVSVAAGGPSVAHRIPSESAPESTEASMQRGGAQWSSRSVHAHVGEQSTVIWIRDTGMTPQQAIHLLERLRPLLSADGAAGKNPIQLHVNGRPVEPGPDQAVRFIDFQERLNGY